jgi:hypothetical protein
MNKKLYRLSNKRVLILERITGRVNSKLEFYEMYVECSKGHVEESENCKLYLKECQGKVNTYSESYDVLNTILNHTDQYFRELNRHNKELTWNNEYDIPIEIYRRGIQTAIDMIKDYWKNPMYKRTDKDGKHIEFLEELLKLRAE